MTIAVVLMVELFLAATARTAVCFEELEAMILGHGTDGLFLTTSLVSPVRIA